MRVVILRGRVRHFCQRECYYLREVVRIICIFFFYLFQKHLFLYMGLVTIINIHCTYLLYMLMCVSFFHLPLHVLFLFSLYAHASYYLYAIYYFYFTQRCLDEFCLKCFRNTGCQSLLAINFLLAKFFKSLCQDRFYCIQQVNMS